MGLVKYLVAILLLIPFLAFADASIDTGSCARESIQSAITTASSSSGVVTVTIPECSATTHTSAVTINMSSGFTNVTSLTIQGAGDHGTKIDSGSFVITGSATKKIRITNLEFSGKNYEQYTGAGAFIVINGASAGFRFDNINWNYTFGRSYLGTNRANGVVDSNTGYHRNQFSSWQYSSHGTAGWAADLAWNTANAVYLENNSVQYHKTDTITLNVAPATTWAVGDTITGQSSEATCKIVRVTSSTVYLIDTRVGTFTSGEVLTNGTYTADQGTGYPRITEAESLMMFADADRGAHVVARYNALTNFYLGGHDASTAPRSARLYEIYNNAMTSTASGATPIVNHRGGTGVIYRNSFEHTSDSPYYASGYVGDAAIMFRNWRDAGAAGSSFYTSTIGNLVCDTSDKKMCLGNSSPETNAYFMKLCSSDADCNGVSGSCIDIDGGTGTKAPCRDQIGAGNNSSPQGLVPFLIWNNKSKRASEEWESTEVVSMSSNIVADTHYCVVGVGESMPATCNGVETTYTAYTCPHPETGLAEGCATTGDTMYGTTGYNTVDDVTAPTVLSVYVNGATMTVNFSEAITSADNAAFTLDPSGADVTVDCPAVATGATSMACTISRALVQSETATYAYTDTKVIDAASNALANIGTTAITGNLTPAEAPTAKLTVNKTGAGCTVTSSPSGISVSGATASDDYAFNSGTVVTLSGYSENGWNAISYGGDCAANGTVTVNAAKECTATCTEVTLFP